MRYSILVFALLVILQQRARSRAANTVTGQVAAEQAMQGALGRLFAVAEAYPE
jgi:hypothetical protein